MIKLIYVMVAIIAITVMSIRSFGGELDLNKASETIQELIFAGKFDEAEPLVRQCLQHVPEELYFLSQLDIVLNGQGKYHAADELRNQIRDIWERHHKATWLAKGSPVSDATWARMIIPAEAYYVVGTEYFQPEVIGSEFTITSFYKIIALPKSQDKETRIFKLEMSTLVEEFYVLRELFPDGGGQQIIPYGDKKPEFRTLVKDAATYLDAEQENH